MSSKNGGKPLLFIHQSISRSPQNSNQEMYTNKRDKVKAKAETMDAKQDNHFVFQQEINELSQSKQELQTNVNDKPGFNRMKSYKEMDLRERLDYLANFPKVLPPVPCVFYTRDTNLQGYLIEYEQDQVTIQFHDQTTKTLAVDDLKDVIMIGIKR